MDYKEIYINNTNKNLLIEFERAIRKSEPDIWASGFDENTFIKNVSKCNFDTENNQVICLHNGSEVIGRCDLIIQKSLMDFGKSVYIDWIYVEIASRKKGIGKLLINEALEYTKKIGATNCYLFTADNQEAKKFYSSLEALTVENKEIAIAYLDV